MADIQFDNSFDAGQPAPPVGHIGKISKMTNTAGAVLSVALIVGIGVWGYRLLVRDVSGVPVVQAMDGPMRVTPKDPGGQLATHQGLSVNQLQSQGVAQDTAQTVQLAPSPIGLIQSDAAGVGERVAVSDQPIAQVEQAQTVAARVPSIVAPTLLGQSTETSQEPAVSTTPEATGLSTSEEIAAALALADQIASGAAPLSQVPPAPNVPVPDATPVATLVPADVSGVSRSPRPLTRPEGFEKMASLQAEAQPSSSATNTAVTSVPVVASVDPDSIAAGTRLAQLGAFDSRAIAESEWTRLSTRFEEFMGDKKRVIQKAESGGRVFYRLRAMGFEDLSDARRFCAALMAEQAACIPVKVR